MPGTSLLPECGLWLLEHAGLEQTWHWLSAYGDDDDNEYGNDDDHDHHDGDDIGDDAGGATPANAWADDNLLANSPLHFSLPQVQLCLRILLWIPPLGLFVGLLVCLFVCLLGCFWSCFIVLNICLQTNLSPLNFSLPQVQLCLLILFLIPPLGLFVCKVFIFVCFFYCFCFFAPTAPFSSPSSFFFGSLL